MNDVFKTINDRRSTRHTKQTRSAKAILILLIEAAVHAPHRSQRSALGISQCFKTKTIGKINDISREMMAQSSSEWMQKMAAKPNFRVTYDAPVLVVVSGRQDAMTTRPTVLLPLKI